MKLRFVIGFCSVVVCLMSCDTKLDFEIDRIPCTYDNVNYYSGDIHPVDPCLTCTASAIRSEWVERYGGCCIDGVFYENGACIDSIFYPEGTINPDNECQYSKSGYYKWLPRPRSCCVDGVYYPGSHSDTIASVNPDNPCEWCVGIVNYSNLEVQETNWTPRGPGAPCPGGSCDSTGLCN